MVYAIDGGKLASNQRILTGIMKTTVIREIASRIAARQNCIKSGNLAWQHSHEDVLRALAEELPSGSGIDCGTKIDLDDSTQDKVVPNPHGGSMSKTIRRDKLAELARAGKLVCVSSYHYDEMSGESRCKAPLEVRMSSGYGDFVEGVINLRESDFRSGCGMARLNDDGTISLYVHSNCNYDFRLKDGASLTPCASGKGKRPENVRMQEFLASHGIAAKAKYLFAGSMRGTWQLYNGQIQWTMELAEKLNALGFLDYDGKPLGQFSGNGGYFSVSVRGHDELLHAYQPQEAA